MTNPITMVTQVLVGPVFSVTLLPFFQISKNLKSRDFQKWSHHPHNTRLGPLLIAIDPHGYNSGKTRGSRASNQLHQEGFRLIVERVSGGHLTIPGQCQLEEKIVAINPLAVVVSITPYGRSGTRKDWSVSPLTEYATGGYHFFSGDPLREPIALPGHQVEFHAAQHAAFAGLAGFYNTCSTGEGQIVELSHQEAILSDHAWLTTIWTHQGPRIPEIPSWPDRWFG